MQSSPQEQTEQSKHERHDNGRKQASKYSFQAVAIQKTDSLQQPSQCLDSNRGDDTGGINVDEDRDYELHETPNNSRLGA
jgi:hypothetical protein